MNIKEAETKVLSIRERNNLGHQSLHRPAVWDPKSMGKRCDQNVVIKSESSALSPVMRRWC